MLPLACAALLDAAESKEAHEDPEDGERTDDDAALGAGGECFPVIADARGILDLLKDFGLLLGAVRVLVNIVILTWHWQHSLDDLDLLPHTAGVHVFPAVLSTLCVVLRVDALHAHGEGSLLEIRLATSPLYDTRIVVCDIATSPDAHADVHRSLRIVLVIESIHGQELTKHLAIEPPLDAIFGPVNRVIVVIVLGRGHVILLAAVESCGIALSKVVCQALLGVGAEKLPVDLVEGFRLQDGRRDDALALGCLHDDLEATEKHVELGLHHR